MEAKGNDESLPSDINRFVLPCESLWDKPFAQHDPETKVELFPYEYMPKLWSEYKPNPAFRENLNENLKDLFRMQQTLRPPYTGRLPPGFKPPGREEQWADSDDDEEEEMVVESKENEVKKKGRFTFLTQHVTPASDFAQPPPEETKTETVSESNQPRMDLA